MHNCQSGTIFDTLPKLMIHDHFTLPLNRDAFCTFHTFVGFVDVPIKLYATWNT
jgi:hypothetical protein